MSILTHSREILRIYLTAVLILEQFRGIFSHHQHHTNEFLNNVITEKEKLVDSLMAKYNDEKKALNQLKAERVLLGHDDGEEEKNRNNHYDDIYNQLVDDIGVKVDPYDTNIDPYADEVPKPLKVYEVTMKMDLLNFFNQNMKKKEHNIDWKHPSRKILKHIHWSIGD